MMLILVTLILYVVAILFFMLTLLFPGIPDDFLIMSTLILMATPNILLWYRISVTRTYKQVEKIPRWKHLINYIRRDNVTVPLYGERAYPGESFLDVPHLGLIEFLGKDCYYTWGDKKYMWGLENINYSPNVKYSNLCHTLWELGFRNSDDVRNVLNGTNLHLMGTVYKNMQIYDNKHGAKKLVRDLEEYEGKTISFKPLVDKKPLNIDGMHNKIDTLLKRNGGN